MKITKEQKNKIKKLKEEGKTILEISEKLKIPYSTVQYHFNESDKNRTLERAKEYQKNNPPKRDENYKAYQREYHRKYYEQHKEKLREYQRNYWHKKND